MAKSLEIPTIELAGRRFGPKGGLFFILGPCVIEDAQAPGRTLDIARRLAEIASRRDIPVLFKASFDKANRTSIQSFRGPGLEQGLEILASVRQETGLPVLSDIHLPQQAPEAAQVLDMLQIPAFLCRQTDLLLAAARTGKPLNIKKGQFLAPGDMAQALAKVQSAKGGQVWLTERGTSFGYHNLVVDMRGIPQMRSLGCPVVFDATHSVQLPGGLGQASGGQRELAPTLARAAVAAGADGVFLEVHPQPGQALCDGPNSLPLAELEPLLERLIRIHQAAREEQA